MDWTPEMVDIVRDMAGNGYSAGQIAMEIPGTTRNAVVGAGHRHNIQFHGSSGGARKKAWQQDPPRNIKPLIAAPAAAPAREPELIPWHVTFEQLSPGDCKWPYGNYDFTFCGHPSIEGFPYCRTHCQMAYTAPQERANVHPIRR